MYKVKSCYNFIQFYKSNSTSDLTRQVLSLNVFFLKKKKQKWKELCLCLIKNDVWSLCSEVVTSCVIFLSLLVTVAYAEWSLSKLKLIRNFLRNSIFQDRLSNISILNLKRTRTEEMDTVKIIL